MKTSRRKLSYEHNRETIKQVALEQIRNKGAEALSLGAIAREIGITTPALYRYFENRSALVNELVRDGYLNFYESLNTTRESILDNSHFQRLKKLCMNYRKWALEHEQEYQIMFGVYLQPEDINAQAGEAADISFLILLEEIHSAVQSGSLTLSKSGIQLPESVMDQLKKIRHRTTNYSEWETLLALSLWSFLHGMTSLELTKKYQLFLSESTDDFFEFEVDFFLAAMGLVDQ